MTIGAGIGATPLEHDARAAMSLDASIDRWPLLGWLPWTRAPKPEDAHEEWDAYTSQRTALQGCLAKDLLLGLLFGGNGSGKSEAAFVVDVIFALGREHPMVRAFARSTGIDVSGVPSGPGRVLLIAKSSNDSVRYHRPRIRDLLPRSLSNKWYNLNGKGESHVNVAGLSESPDGAIVKTRQGAEVWFKSQDQGWESFQGDKWRLVHIDEELVVDDGEKIYNELLMRVARIKGRIIYSMTALSGETWTYRRLVQTPPEASAVWWLDAFENPHLPAESMRIAFAGLSEAEVKQRRYGKFVSLEGRIYPALNLSRDRVGDGTGPEHLLHASWVPPADWPRVLAFDFGWTDPSVALWGAVDDEGRLYWYRVLYITQETAERFAHMVAWLSGITDDPIVIPSRGGHPCVYGADRPSGFVGEEWDGEPTEGERIQLAWGDPSHPAHLRALRRAGVRVVKARKDWEDGVARVRVRTALQGDKRPRLYLREDLRPVIREHQGYVHASGAGGAKETPARGPDHTCDAGRYMVVGVDRTFRRT